MRTALRSGSRHALANPLCVPLPGCLALGLKVLKDTGVRCRRVTAHRRAHSQTLTFSSTSPDSVAGVVGEGTEEGGAETSCCSEAEAAGSHPAAPSDGTAPGPVLATMATGCAEVEVLPADASSDLEPPGATSGSTDAAASGTEATDAAVSSWSWVWCDICIKWCADNSSSWEHGRA